MGAVAALLAGACVAPVVIQVVLFSSNLYATGTPLALALPFFLGIGMAIPWPIAGAGIAALPKPGAWMVRVKQAFGVFILAHRRLLRLRGVRALRESLGRSVRGHIERRGAAQSRLALVARRGARRREAREEAGADRHVGHLVQELPDDGQDDAARTRTSNGAVGLREDQVPGGRSGCEPRGTRFCSGFPPPGLPAYAILKPKN